MIQSFNQLGIYHPGGFNETESSRPEMNRDVYPENKMIKGKLPRVLFMPSQKLMWDIMQACIGCLEPGDLWFKNGDDDAE